MVSAPKAVQELALPDVIVPGPLWTIDTLPLLSDSVAPPPTMVLPAGQLAVTPLSELLLALAAVTISTPLTPAGPAGPWMPWIPWAPASPLSPLRPWMP